MYSNDLVCDIVKYINNNINKKISIDDLVNTFHFNRYYIMKLFKKELDISIINYINYKRILNSINSMQNNNNSILKIALDNGFYSQEYFSEMFTKIVGINPTKYKSIMKNKHYSSNQEIEGILKNIIKLNNVEDNITKYLSRRKIKGKNIVLSIFR